MSNYMNQVVHLTEAQYQTLITNGSITVGGQTITYSPDDLYITTQNLTYSDRDSAQGSALNYLVTKVTQAANGQISVEKMPFPVIIKTTAEWTTSANYIASAGTVLIYTDWGSITETVNNTEVTKNVPAVKVADGSTPAVDLAFIGDDHIKDLVRHITAAERASWNNKITCENTVTNNNLILTRD